MPLLKDYNHFDGRHWETGSIQHVLAYEGVKAPHTGQPVSEALLMGISGGAVVGYFSFAYKGYDPHVALLTRNTFNPMETIFDRLAIPRRVLQTGSAQTAVKNLVETLEDDVPAMVWADAMSLPYNGMTPDPGMWLMWPIVVYGYAEAADQVCIADRARVPLVISTGELAAARARVKQDKHRILVLDPPDMNKLPSAAQKGIFDCIKLYTEAPPKGSKHNFGFAALKRWADLLVKPKMSNSWAQVFPPGRPLYAGLTTTLTAIMFFGHDGPAERDTYADFLDEASVLLNRPPLKEAAAKFRASAPAWRAFADALLPDDVSPLKETRELMFRRHRLFIDAGSAALGEMRAISTRLDSIKDAVTADFPLDSAGVAGLMEALRAHVLKIHNLEFEAVSALQAAMA